MPFFLQVATNLPAHQPQVTKYRAIHNVFGHAFQLFIPHVHYYFVHPHTQSHRHPPGTHEDI